MLSNIINKHVFSPKRQNKDTKLI